MSDEQKPVANDFNPDWDVVTPMVEEQQRMAKRVEELEAVGAQLVEALEFCRFSLEPYDDIKPRDWKTDRENLRRAHQQSKAALAAVKEAGL